MNFDGTDRKDVPMPSLGDQLFIGLVRWSPDGKKLVMNNSVFEPGIPLVYVGAQLLVYDLENGKLMQLADKDEDCLGAMWSPTSQQVAATCFPNPSNENEITDPSLIPSTVRIFGVNQPGQPYGGSPFSLCSDLSWSPDGKQLAFVCDKDKSHKGLFVENSNGNGVHEVKLGILGNPAVLKNPVWSPDGTQIIYVAGADYKNTNIYSAQLDGSGNHALTNQEASYSLISVYPIP
jgi:Tol biopolymer transport system component